MAANNYAMTLSELNRFEEVKTLMRKTIPALNGSLHDHASRRRRRSVGDVDGCSGGARAGRGTEPGEVVGERTDTISETPL